MKWSERSSNVELLRLFLMFFILMHHLLLHGLHNIGFEDNYPAERWATFLDPFFYIGVNGFVLISGFFGIKFKITGLYKLFIQCAFYGLVGYLIHLYVDGAHIGRSIFNNCITVFSFPPGWWFIQCYLYLYMCAPLLNSAIAWMGKQQYGLVLSCVGILDIYFGWLRDNPIGQGGYGLLHFIFLYLLGNYISQYVAYRNLSGWVYAVCWLFLSVLLGALAVCNTCYWHKSCTVFNTHVYNHPLLIVSSLAFFLCFMRMNIRSNKVVNWLSSSCFAVYLIPENQYIRRYIYTQIAPLTQSFNPLRTFGLLIVIAMGIMILCLLFDKIRLFIMRPIDIPVNNALKAIDAKRRWC